MWLMGGVVRKYIDILIIIITFPYSTCISSFLAAASLLLCLFLKCFSFLFILFLCNIANVAQRKSRSRERGDIINYIDKNVECTSNAEPEPCARYRVTFQESCS